MTTIRLNNKYREKILDEWSKIMLQTKTPMRKKLDEAVSRFLGARTNAYQVAINIVHERISASDMETFKKFGQIEYHKTDIDAYTTFDVSQEEQVYGAMRGEDKNKTVNKPFKFNYSNDGLDFSLDQEHAIALHFDDLIQSGLNPFLHSYFCKNIPDSFYKPRRDKKVHFDIYAWLKDNCPVISTWEKELRKKNPFYFDLPDVQSHKMDFKVKTLEEYEIILDHMGARQKLALSVEKLLDEHYTNLTKMREYLKTCKDTDDVKKVWNDFNYTILNEKIGTALSIVSADLVDDLKSLMELR